MVDIKILHPGDKIRIVDKWPDPESGHQNHRGLMDRYLGQIMTVWKIESRSVLCEEDKHDPNSFYDHGWYWHPELIDSVVSPSGLAKPASSDELASFLGF